MRSTEFNISYISDLFHSRLDTHCKFAVPVYLVAARYMNASVVERGTFCFGNVCYVCTFVVVLLCVEVQK